MKNEVICCFTEPNYIKVGVHSGQAYAEMEIPAEPKGYLLFME